MPRKKPMPTGFAVALRRLRTQAGLTQAQLAERAGIHELTIAKLEWGGHEPSWPNVVAILDATGWDVRDFYVKADERIKPTGQPMGRPKREAEPEKPKRKRKGPADQKMNN